MISPLPSVWVVANLAPSARLWTLDRTLCGPHISKRICSSNRIFAVLIAQTEQYSVHGDAALPLESPHAQTMKRTGPSRSSLQGTGRTEVKAGAAIWHRSPIHAIGASTEPARSHSSPVTPRNNERLSLLLLCPHCAAHCLGHLDIPRCNAGPWLQEPISRDVVAPHRRAPPPSHLNVRSLLHAGPL